MTWGASGHPSSGMLHCTPASWQCQTHVLCAGTVQDTESIHMVLGAAEPGHSTRAAQTCSHHSARHGRAGQTCVGGSGTCRSFCQVCDIPRYQAPQERYRRLSLYLMLMLTLTLCPA